MYSIFEVRFSYSIELKFKNCPLCVAHSGLESRVCFFHKGNVAREHNANRLKENITFKFFPEEWNHSKRVKLSMCSTLFRSNNSAGHFFTLLPPDTFMDSTIQYIQNSFSKQDLILTRIKNIMR